MKKEISANALSGGLMLIINLALYAASIYLMFQLKENKNDVAIIVSALGLLTVASIMSAGFFTVEPGSCKVIVVFGKYRGSVRESGFFWVNPLGLKRTTVSLRARTLNGERLKVNDSAGNPIEIATVVVWQVDDTYEACFEVDDYEKYVQMQSETALRHTASIFPYDADDQQVTLRRNTVEVAEHLQDELRERLSLAGVKIIEARLSHLAYSPEIAGVMLRRQQAAAVVAARQTIVDGAVGMVEMALARLEKEQVIELDEERKAAMVSNLLVVLCSEQAAAPVVNAGTLYN